MSTKSQLVCQTSEFKDPIHVRITQLSFPSTLSQNSANSWTKIFVITVKGLEPVTLVLETRMLPQCQQDTCERRDL